FRRTRFQIELFIQHLHNLFFGDHFIEVPAVIITDVHKLDETQCHAVQLFEITRHRYDFMFVQPSLDHHVHLDFKSDGLCIFDLLQYSRCTDASVVDLPEQLVIQCIKADVQSAKTCVV